jgi:hypothetical protein
MSKEVTVTPVTSLIPTQDELNVVMTIAKTAVTSQYFKTLGGEAGIVMIALYAKEIGVPIVSALMGGMTNVMGKITISPELMNSLIRQNGHKLEILESTDQICRIKGTRRDTGETYIASFSLEDAKRARLVKEGGGYDKYATDMLFARCISRLRRRLFPDVACRSYVHGEIEEEPQSNEKKEPEQVEEAVSVVVAESHQPELISEAQVKEIEENILPTDKEYRDNLLGYFGNGKPLEDFSKLPAARFEGAMKAIMKRKAKMQTKEEEE